MSATGLVLAAGAGRRMGAPKAELVVDDERLMDRAVRALRDSGCDEVVVVTRVDVEVPDAVVVVNPTPERGMGSSLAIGLDASSGDVAVILLVDTPGIGADAVRRVLAAPGEVAIATYGGRRGHPVRLGRRWWPEVIERAVGDQGARAFLTAHPELVTEVPCSGDPIDLDTPADIETWRTRRRGGSAGR
jgi:CTP:molybdopterin cytidylyltransferase MocA